MLKLEVMLDGNSFLIDGDVTFQDALTGLNRFFSVISDQVTDIQAITDQLNAQTDALEQAVTANTLQHKE